MMDGVRALWRRADALAAATPDSRNRYVDFLRAASIAVVVLGHWLAAAPHVRGGELVADHILAAAPWTHWLTLGVQVMPVFFLVGGYANAVAWRAARSRGMAYGPWLAGRIQRLIAPVLPVLGLWIALSLAAVALGTSPEAVGLITQTALVPTWFLAVYVMVGVLVPWTFAAWERFGIASFAALVAGAVLVDAVALGTGARWLGYANYGFVWLAVHQLGHAWQAGRLRAPLVWSACGAAALAALVGIGPYPLAMVGVPGEALGNTSPPTIALLALGITQIGVVISLERAARRLLARRALWTATVMVNAMIMTVYLWHMTALIGVVAAVFALGGFGLSAEPASAFWWGVRLPWLVAYGAGLVLLVALFLRFERSGEPARCTSRPRLVTGAALTCLGLGLLSAQGIVGATGVRVLPTLMPLVGGGLAGVGPLARLLRCARR